MPDTHIPGQVIRPVDPIVFDWIRVGFHRNPTSFIKNRSDPTWFLSDSFRSESGPEFNGTRWNPTRSDPDFIGFRRIPMKSVPDSDRKESDKNRVGSDRNIQIRQDPIPPLWPGIAQIDIFISIRWKHLYRFTRLSWLIFLTGRYKTAGFFIKFSISRMSDTHIININWKIMNTKPAKSPNVCIRFVKSL